MDENRVKGEMVSWLLNFIQTDLNTLSEEEMDVLRLRLSHFYWRLAKKPRAKLHPKENAKVFSQGEYILGGDHPYKIQATLRKFLDTLFSKKFEFARLPLIPRSLSIDSGGRYEIQYRPYEPVGELEFVRLTEGKTILIPPKDRTSRYEDIFVDCLSRLLEGLPKDTIRKCHECGRLFVHLSAKKKIYCSNYCAWKNLSRKRREELKKHPRKYEAFLKKQRETMKRRYEKKRKGELLVDKPSPPKTIKEKLLDEKLREDTLEKEE